MPRKTCNDCIYFKPRDENGFCFANPPTMVTDTVHRSESRGKIISEDDHTYAPFRPVVASTDLACRFYTVVNDIAVVNP